MAADPIQEAVDSATLALSGLGATAQGAVARAKGMSFDSASLAVV